MYISRSHARDYHQNGCVLGVSQYPHQCAYLSVLIAALFAILSSARFHLYQLRQGTHSNKNPDCNSGCDGTVLIGRNPIKCKTAFADPMAIESTSSVLGACCRGKSPSGMTPALADNATSIMHA